MADPADASSRSGIPDALECWWPIPISRDTEGLFCDLASEGAATGLLALMTGISEEYWAASWIMGLEYSCWRAISRGPSPFGKSMLSQRQCELLRLLSEEASGWWHWTDEGPRFAPLENWTAHFAAIATETGTAETGTGSVHEGAGRQASPETSRIESLEAQVAALREALGRAEIRLRPHIDDTLEDDRRDKRIAHMILKEALSNNEGRVG